MCEGRQEAPERGIFRLNRALSGSNALLAASYYAKTQRVIGPVVEHGVWQEEKEETDFQREGLQQADVQRPGDNTHTNNDKTAGATGCARLAEGDLD